MLTPDCLAQNTALQSVSKYFKLIQEMLPSARERAIIVTLLALQHSATSLRLYRDMKDNVAS